jgi:hypothetical protein
VLQEERAIVMSASAAKNLMAFFMVMFVFDLVINS